MIKKNPKLVIVEDDTGFNKLISSYLISNGFEVTSYFSGEECLEKIDQRPDIVLQDFDLPGINGIETMKQLKKRYPSSIFIFLSGESNISIAVDAMKQGAYDYIVKNAFAKEDVLHKINNAEFLNGINYERKIFKYILYFFAAALLLSWLYFLIK